MTRVLVALSIFFGSFGVSWAADMVVPKPKPPCTSSCITVNVGSLYYVQGNLAGKDGVRNDTEIPFDKEYWELREAPANTAVASKEAEAAASEAKVRTSTKSSSQVVRKESDPGLTDDLLGFVWMITPYDVRDVSFGKGAKIIITFVFFLIVLAIVFAVFAAVCWIIIRMFKGSGGQTPPPAGPVPVSPQRAAPPAPRKIPEAETPAAPAPTPQAASPAAESSTKEETKPPEPEEKPETAEEKVPEPDSPEIANKRSNLHHAVSGLKKGDLVSFAERLLGNVPEAERDSLKIGGTREVKPADLMEAALREYVKNLINDAPASAIKAYQPPKQK